MLERLRISALALLVAVVTVVLIPVPGQAEDLTSLLEQVGSVYADAYVSPISHTMGANQNSALYHTARIPKSTLTLGIGLKVMGTKLNSDDKYFRKNYEVSDLGAYFDDPALNGQAGIIVMQGPTVFGSPDEEGTVTGYVDGIPVAQVPGIPGLLESSWSPLVAPELWVGGFYGARLNVRWFPEVNISDFGKTKYFGWGLQWGVNTVAPTLPVDIMVGFFTQQIDLGKTLETDASSFFAAVSKDYSVATLYGGFAKESSDLKVAYTFDPGGPDEADISFEVESKMKARFTLGATFDLGAKFNVEAAFGNLNVYSVGLLFGR